MTSPVPGNHDEILSQFCSTTGKTPSEAIPILEASDWNLQAALQLTSSLPRTWNIVFAHTSRLIIDHRQSFDYPGTIAIPIEQPYVEALYPGGMPLNDQQYRQYMAQRAELERKQFQRQLQMEFFFSTLLVFCCCFTF